MSCYLRAIAHFLPSKRRTNEDLVSMNPGWSEDAIFRKTGIRTRPIAESNETSLDLGWAAAEKLLREKSIDRDSIDSLIFVTESPDYLVPPNACVLQNRLGLPTNVASFDVNLGCSGFIYGLMLGRSMIVAQTAKRVLLVCAETYSRYCDPHDLATVTLFGDGAAAALITDERHGSLAEIGACVLGTDGSGYQELIVENGGARQFSLAEECEESGLKRRLLKMHGPEVFRFALDRVKPACDELLSRVGKTWDDVDVCLCHQANRFMLEALRQNLEIPKAKLPIDVEEIGNLSTASLPVFISRWVDMKKWRTAKVALAIGFGVGYSWGVTWLTWHVED